MSTEQLAVPLIRTKLYRPSVPPDYVTRERLNARLEVGINLPLTVLAAPAGYGKSSLVSHWLGAKGFSSGWLSLDESDNDVRVFLSYFIAALRTCSADACQNTLNILYADKLPPLPVITAQLSNDLDELSERTVLVLDDYHCIREPEIHSILDDLLKHPSQQLHLAILSRRDPVLSLVSLRMRNLLTEIRMRDLEFTKEEMFSLLRQATGHDVEATMIEQLQKKTEGWPAAIRLAALALHDQADVEGLLNRFGSDVRLFREYIIDDVLSRLSPLIRERLLSISILDRFNASLCETVWGDQAEDGENFLSGENSGEEFIETLKKYDLFCIALDRQHSWYRFHHLFGEVLYQQFEQIRSQEQIRKLQQRASHWFAKNGFYEDAIQHAVAVDDTEHAAQIVGSARHEVMNHDHWPRLERWLNFFTRDQIEQYPQLMVLRCWLNLSYWYRLDTLTKDLDKVESLLESSTIEASEVGALKTEVNVMRSSLAYWTVNSSIVAELTEPALRELKGNREYVHSIALMYRAGAHQLLGDIRKAESLLIEHIEGETIKGPESQARIMQALCFIYWSFGDTRKLFHAASRLLEISQKSDIPWSHSFARYFLGVKHYECNDLEDAIAHLEVIVNEPYRYPIKNVIHCSFLLSLCYQSHGMSDRASDVANNIYKLALELGNGPFVELAEAFMAELDLRQGRTAQAQHWASNIQLKATHTLHRFFNAEFTAIKSMMTSNSPQSRKIAAEQLDALENLMQRSHHRRLRIDLLGMKALLANGEANAENNSDTSLTLLREAIELGQPGQLIRPLADLGTEIAGLLNRLDLDHEGLQYAGRIYAAIGRNREAGTDKNEQKVLPESLSQRELQILDLFSKDMTNNEIAERLYISTGTVKRHAHNIYEKLSVSGRRDAVSKAVRLGILITN